MYPIPISLYFLVSGCHSHRMCLCLYQCRPICLCGTIHIPVSRHIGFGAACSLSISQDKFQKLLKEEFYFPLHFNYCVNFTCTLYILIIYTPFCARLSVPYNVTMAISLYYFVSGCQSQTMYPASGSLSLLTEDCHFAFLY